MPQNQKGNNAKKQQMATEKPKFDKKKWREKKYSKKFKVAEWEKKREKAVLKQYYKDLKKDPLYSHTLQPRGNDNPDVNSTTASGPDSLVNNESRLPTSKRKKLNSFEAARAEMRRIQEERNRQKEERLRRKKEMEEQLAKYKMKRAEKFKVLSKKNNKGQPVMKGRLQLLYDQIKQSANPD